MLVYGNLERAALDLLASDPSTSGDKFLGRVWYNTGTNLAKYWDGTAVRTLVNTDLSQALTNKTIDAASNTISNISNTEVKAAAAIAVNKLAALSASKAVVSDASGFLASAASTTTTEIGYVNGLTSSAQTQLDARVFKSTLSAKGSLISATAASTPSELVVGTNGKYLQAQSGQTSGLLWATPATSDLAALTASRAAVTDASGYLAAAAATTLTEIGYINGLTSAVQTQLDARVFKSTLSAKGSLISASAASTPSEVTVGTNGYILTADSTQTGGMKWSSPSSATNFSRNYLMNAEFRFFQRQTPLTLTAVANDAYGPDRWYGLSSNATSTQVARVAENISSSPTAYVCQVRQANASTTQHGLFQIIENANCIELRGQTVQFSFWARTDGTEVVALRAGIVEWTGTADTVTSAIVSSWAATPTLIANATFINTPSSLTVSSSWAQFTVTATLGSTFTNLIMAVWTPTAEAQNDDFYITQTQLTPGSLAFNWSILSKNYNQDLAECQRYYEKSYDVDTVPGSATTNGCEYMVACRAYTQGGGLALASCRYKVPKFSSSGAAPTIYSTGGASAKVYDFSGGADAAAGVQDNGYTAFSLDFTTVDTRAYRWQWTCNGEL